jgi:hypothetical protein
VDVLYCRRTRRGRWLGRGTDDCRGCRRSEAARRPELVRVARRALVRLRCVRARVDVEALVAARDGDAAVRREVPVLLGEAWVAGVDLCGPVVVRARPGVEAAARA